jgi:hypothetical protein
MPLLFRGFLQLPISLALALVHRPLSPLLMRPEMRSPVVEVTFEISLIEGLVQQVDGVFGGFQRLWSVEMGPASLAQGAYGRGVGLGIRRPRRFAALDLIY